MHAALGWANVAIAFALILALLAFLVVGDAARDVIGTVGVSLFLAFWATASGRWLLERGFERARLVPTKSERERDEQAFRLISIVAQNILALGLIALGLVGLIPDEYGDRDATGLLLSVLVGALFVGAWVQTAREGRWPW